MGLGLGLGSGLDEAAVPRQLPITATSMATPMPGRAASHTEPSETGLPSMRSLRPLSTSMNSDAPHVPAAATQSRQPAAKPDCENANGSESRPVPMQVEERLRRQERMVALPPGAASPSSE